MRLANFRLERYGPFEQLDLPLDTTPGRINLIVAPNGYGKSVIRRSIQEFLFGIEARTPMTFRFGTERMLLKADVSFDGSTVQLVRRKGNGNTLARADGPEYPADSTRHMLGGANETTFRELFGLDTGLLRSGGRDLIHSQGRLGQVLFAAGGGMGRVRDLLTDLERKRDDLGRANVKHKSRPLWNALSNWELSVQDLKRAALRPADFVTLERQAEETARQLEILLAEQAAETEERDRLRTIRACRPWLDRLRTTQHTLDMSADTPDLDPDFEKRWRDALTERATAQASVTDADRDLRSAREEREKLTFDPAWIAAAAGIKEVGDLRGVAQAAERDRPAVARDLAAHRTNAARLRHDLGWDDTVALPPAPVVKDAQRRLQQHPKLDHEAAAAQDRLAEADRQLNATANELETLPNHTGVAALDDLAKLLRAGGDPAVRLDTARRKPREAEAALRTALGAIPDCPLAETVLHSTAAPSEGRLEAAGKALNDAEAAHAGARRDHDRQTRAIAAENSKLLTLERTASLPPPDALAAARAGRDALWVRFQDPGPNPSAAVAFDRAIRDADRIADTLIAHAKEVAEAAAIRDNLRILDAEQAGHAAELTRTAAAVARARDDLLVMARTAGGNATDMTALRAFLTARAAAIGCRDARDAAAADLLDTETSLGAIGGRLAQALNLAMPDLAAIGTLLAEADRRIDADRALAAHRRTLTEQAARQRATKATAAAAAAKADRALADWQTQWQPIATALARPADEPIAATTDAVTRIEELRNTEQNIARDQHRVDDMGDAIALLTTKVGLLATLSPELAALPPTEAADALQRHLQAQHIAAANCAAADRRIEQAAQKHTLCLAATETAARTLAGLRAALRADTDDEAEQQLQRARAAAAARTTHAEALRELAAQGGGLTTEALAARAAQTTPEADTARIGAIDDSHQTRLALIEAARNACTAATAALNQASTGMAAAEAAQRREAAQAMLARTAEEALILHATHALLRTALDNQAAAASPPLLNRIGEVFRTITGGAQAGVRIEDTRDGQTMVALEADGTTRKTLDQLSEGTCDQLYLALRIAALEEYAAAATPLPFIADDILQTFDDPRTTATLHALAALSTRVQVIVLTHHRHVGELAAGLADDVVHVIALADETCVPRHSALDRHAV